jgi:hypothetical protein
MARLREYLDCIRQSGEGISTAALPFDILQGVFVSQAASHLRTVGTKGDRLYQIEVGLPDGLSFKPREDKALIPRLADQNHSSNRSCLSHPTPEGSPSKGSGPARKPRGGAVIRPFTRVSLASA